MADVITDSTYGSLEDDQVIVDRYKRELGRIRASPSFRLAKLFSSCARKPWRLIWLPFSILILLFSIVKERTGSKPRLSETEVSNNSSSSRNCIVMFPTNGVGFGHFTRMLAVARRMRAMDPDLEIIFFTTMPTLHLLKEEGFPSYHLPNRKKFKGMKTSTWNAISQEMISDVFAVHRPRAFIFDGTYPYRGMLNAIKDRDDILRIWLRRPVSNQRSSSIPVDSYSHFDLLINPGDGMSGTSRKPDDEIENISCKPILLHDKGDLLDKEVLRNRLGIPIDAIVCYIQLGAGRINDIDSDVSLAIESVISKGGYAVVGESMLGKRFEMEAIENLRILRDYPNSRFFNSFDFAIIAGGYNSYHEVISLALPSICIPNEKTGMDDQAARARKGAELGCIHVLKDVNMSSMDKAVEKMMNEETRTSMKAAANDIVLGNGAEEIAQDLIQRMNNSV